MEFSEIINFIVQNGIGVVCVGYLIYFQSTTMQKMVDTLDRINGRLSRVEKALDIGDDTNDD